MSLCLASLFTTIVDWRGCSLPLILPPNENINVLLVLACFVCTRIMVVLQYRNLLLLCGGISKPVVHCRSLIYSLLHCSLYVCSVRKLSAIPTVPWLSVHGVTMTGIEWSAAFKDAHLRVWRATIKQDYTKKKKMYPVFKATIINKYGKLKRTS